MAVHTRVLSDGIAAGAVAAVVSGAPSTSWALAAGRDPLEPTLAAGSLVLPRERRRGRLFAAAVPARVRALPLLPQLADHALSGATVGFVLDRRRR